MPFLSFYTVSFHGLFCILKGRKLTFSIEEMKDFFAKISNFTLSQVPLAAFCLKNHFVSIPLVTPFWFPSKILATFDSENHATYFVYQNKLFSKFKNIMASPEIEIDWAKMMCVCVENDLFTKCQKSEVPSYRAVTEKVNKNREKKWDCVR